MGIAPGIAFADAPRRLVCPVCSAGEGRYSGSGEGPAMSVRTVAPGVQSVGAIDWDRRLFDDLIPLPEGTSYNAFLVRGSEKVALIDAVDTIDGDGHDDQPLPGRGRPDRLHRGQPRRAGPLGARAAPARDVRRGDRGDEQGLQGPPGRVPRDPRGADPGRRRPGDALARRQDARVPDHALGPLAGHDADLPPRGAGPLLVRPLRRPPRDQRPLPARPGRVVPPGQALLRRDHDAVPEQHQGVPREGARARTRRSSPRATARSTTSRRSCWPRTTTGSRTR